MKFLNSSFLLIVFTALFLKSVFSQSTLYEVDQLQKIEIYFNDANWDYQLDTMKIGTDSYLMASWLKINGVAFDSAGVKYKGNSSYDSSYQKNPIHIALDEFKSQSYQGFSDIKLSNGHSDPSMIREVLSYEILSNYMDCPEANFAQVYINDQYIGLYTNVENIDREYCSDLYYTSDGVFIKANPASPGPYSRSNLKYISNDSSAYFNLYELKSETGWNELVLLCNQVTNHPEVIDSIFDMDKVLWMLAFNNAFVNLDSYSGAFAQNYYLYRDQHNQYNPLIWDLNMSFGGFPFAGLQGGGMGSLNVNDMQNLPISLHFADADWPLIKNTMGNVKLRKIYHAHLRTIINDFFSNQSFLSLAQQLQTIIDTAIFSDENKFFTYEQFLGGLNSNVQFGSYTVPGIQVLMDTRVDFLQNSPEFSFLHPMISLVNVENENPEMNTEVFITADIENSNPDGVYLGYRYEHSANFIQMEMYDDGLHHDGTSGDHKFGTSFIMGSDWVDYYIYAENDQASIFSPERAEYEFYSLQAVIPTALPGEIVINEFLAVNQNDTIDEAGQFEDWIEIYNTTELSVDLFGLYLSDDLSNPMKFAFPENTIIQSHDFLTIWADEDGSSSDYLHCNFKLSGNGEKIMLSNIEGIILDSITFGPQSPNVSMGRCPDGLGELAVLPNTSFNSANCESGISVVSAVLNNLEVYPNPADKSFVVKNKGTRQVITYKLVNYLGEFFGSGVLNKEVVIDASFWPSGVYALIVDDISSVKIIVIH